MTWIDWYDSLEKPSWTPAPSTISLIWTLLYPVILVSFGFVFAKAFRVRLPYRVALPFAINLVANLLFMPIFAGLRHVPLAAVDIVIVWATILWCVVAVWPYYRWVALAQVPYLAWVSVATVLQLSICFNLRLRGG
jgi:translocator protein